MRKRSYALNPTYSKNGKRIGQPLKEDPPPLLTVELLREYFSYDAETGHLIRLKSVSGNGKVGAPAGVMDNVGYRRIKFFRTRYQAHRLVWMFHHGSLPAGMLDHINQDRADNRIENLREVTASQNCKNRKKETRTASGRRGVSYFARDRLWVANVNINKKQTYLGSFKTREEAIAAREAAEKEHGYL
jgi:hypothetical protein